MRRQEEFRLTWRYTGSTRRAGQAVVNDDVVRIHYPCKGCGHRWAAVEGRQSEALRPPVPPDRPATIRSERP